MVILQGLGYIVSGIAAVVAIMIGFIAVVAALAWLYDLFAEPLLKRVPKIIPFMVSIVGKTLLILIGVVVFGAMFYQLGHDLWT